MTLRAVPGRRPAEQAQGAIQRREERLLRVLAPDVRAGILAALHQLSNEAALADLEG